MLEHTRRETDSELLAATVRALKRASVADQSGRVPTRLVEMFTQALDLQVRVSILAAFRCYPHIHDGAHLEKLARMAKPGEEQRKIAELIARGDAAALTVPPTTTSPSGPPR